MIDPASVSLHNLLDLLYVASLLRGRHLDHLLIARKGISVIDSRLATYAYIHDQEVSPLDRVCSTLARPPPTHRFLVSGQFVSAQFVDYPTDPHRDSDGDRDRYRRKW
jgi:hypothetical protein